MAEDWAIDVKKYAPDADDAVIAAIVKYCGIALRTRDAALVSFSDKKETDRVRDGYCRKKLALTESDAVVDKAIADVGKVMKADKTRNRVTVYYLLAEKFGKLGVFAAKKAATKATAPKVNAAKPAAKAAAKAAVAKPAAAKLAAVAPVVAEPAMAKPAVVEPVIVKPAAPEPVAIAPTPPKPVVAAAPMAAYADANAAPAASGMGKWLWILALLALGVLLLWWLFGRTPQEEVAVVVPDAPIAAATAPVAAVAVPAGAGVTAAEIDGAPMVSVYFDTAKTDVAPEFATTAAQIKQWGDDHPGTMLVVSGYNDPSGDPAFNAELAKNRAVAVRVALVALGVPESGIELVKPADTTDTSGDPANGRRVDIRIKSPG